MVFLIFTKISNPKRNCHDAELPAGKARLLAYLRLGSFEGQPATIGSRLSGLGIRD